MGVPLSPEPEVRSQREPMRSVRRRGVVPWLSILPVRSPSFWRMYSLMASRRASPVRWAKLLSAPAACGGGFPWSSKKFGVAAGAIKHQDQNILHHLIDKQPVRGDVALPAALVVSGQVVVTVFWLFPL